jgi:hypothetical protein
MREKTHPSASPFQLRQHRRHILLVYDMRPIRSCTRHTITREHCPPSHFPLPELLLISRRRNQQFVRRPSAARSRYRALRVNGGAGSGMGETRKGADVIETAENGET